MENKCPKCGKKIDTNSNYDCPICGEKFWQSKEKFESHVKSLDPLLVEVDEKESKNNQIRSKEKEIETTQGLSEKYCVNCNKNNDYDASYCIYCGKKIDQQIKDTNKDEVRHHDLEPASQGRRLLNLLIDYSVMIIITYLVTVIVDAFKYRLIFEEDFWIGPIIFVGYYLTLEYFFGKSIGKFVTKTKVVDSKGNKPTLNQVAGRTLFRLIPFEFFSFGSYDPVGWHDKFSGTVVIRDN